MTILVVHLGEFFVVPTKFTETNSLLFPCCGKMLDPATNTKLATVPKLCDMIKDFTQHDSE